MASALMREGWGGGNIKDAISRQRVIASPAFRKALQAAHKKLNEASHEALHPRPR